MKPSKAPSFVKPQDQAPEDKLDAIRAKAARARDIGLEIEDLEQRIEVLSSEQTELLTKTIPDALDEVALDKLGLPASGNLPAYDVNIQPFYSANIAASWPPAKRAEAFKYLESLEEGDLIKTEVAIAFPRDQRKKAVALRIELEKKGLTPDIKEAVHMQTLTAWLKRKVEDEHFIPDLDKIGGTVGRVARLKERKSK